MYDSMIYQFQHSFHPGSVETPKPSEFTRKQKVTRHSIGNKKMSWASAHGHSQHKQQKLRVSSYMEEVLEWVAIQCKYPLWMQSQLTGSTELTCIIALPALLYNLTMHDNLQNSTNQLYVCWLYYSYSNTAKDYGNTILESDEQCSQKGFYSCL